MTDDEDDPDKPSRAALTFDPQEYLHFLDESGWTAAQKIEFIKELWKIIQGFADIGFDLHPVQQVIDANSLVPDSGAVLPFDDNSESKNETDAERSDEQAAEEEDS